MPLCSGDRHLGARCSKYYILGMRVTTHGPQFFRGVDCPPIKDKTLQDQRSSIIRYDHNPEISR